MVNYNKFGYGHTSINMFILTPALFIPIYKADLDSVMLCTIALKPTF